MSDAQGEQSLTHVGPDGSVRMVDVGAKAATDRFAAAEAFVRLSSEAVKQLRADELKKGPALEVARIAGIMAAKRTAELIPLCHSLALDHVGVDLAVVDDGVTIRAEARTRGPTGVEMEALVAASVAAATIIDMTKSVDRAACIERVRVVEKAGGRSGHWVADAGGGAS